MFGPGSVGAAFDPVPESCGALKKSKTSKTKRIEVQMSVMGTSRAVVRGRTFNVSIEALLRSDRANSVQVNCFVETL